MKKVYLFVFIGIIAIIMVVISLMNFNPAVDTWSSLFAGGAFAIFIIKLPAIIAYYKSGQKSRK